MTRARFDVLQTTDNVTVDRVKSGRYTRPGLEMTTVPKFKLDIVNPSGVDMYKLATGKELTIKRNNQLEFTGIVETPTGIEGEGVGVTSVTVEGIHKGYSLLRAAQCTSYDFDEDNNPATSRDAVTIDPWETFILRREDGTVDEYGNTKGIDGITVDQYVAHILGSKFVYQHRFEDNTHLLASQANSRGTSSNFLTVYRDGKTGDLSPSLQRYRDGANFKAGTFVESVPLYNNDRNVSRMGTIQSAQVLIIGNRVSKISNAVLGSALAGGTGIDSDVTGHSRHLTTTGSPTTRNAATLTKFNLGRNLDGVDDAYFTSDQTFNCVGSMTYLFAGIVDILPTGANKFYLGGWFDGSATVPWSLYVDSTGAVVFYHSNGLTNLTLSTGAGAVVAGTEFVVDVWRDQVTGNVQLRVNNSAYYNTAYDPLINPPGKPITGLFTIGTNDVVNTAFHGDGGVFEARFWSKTVNTDTLEKICTNSSSDYYAFLEGTEEAAWFMFGETNPGTFTTFTGQDPTLQLCRNGIEATRTYSPVTLARTSNYNQSGLEAWTGTITFAGSENVKNALAYKVTLPGTTADASSTKIYYIKVICVTTIDTGLTVGAIDTYANPFPFNGEENWIATSVQGMHRLEAMEKVRKLTEADTSVNPNPNWDMWVNDSLAFFFRQRRGSALNTYHTYSFAAKNLKKISHEFYGGELAYQTIAYGAGSGIAQTRIVSKQEYSAGGLYDSDRDPGGSTRRYGALPRCLSFVDSNETSAVALLRKARAYHRLHRDPIENVIVEIINETIPFFDVGDSAKFVNLRTKTNGPLRIVNLGREWSGADREKVTVEIGQKYAGLIDDIASDHQQTKVISIRQQPQDNVTGLSGNGLYFTSTKYGVYKFAIQDGKNVDRVFLDISTLPWQITARGGVTQPIQTSTSATHTHPSTDISVGLQGVSSGNLGMPPASIPIAQSITVASGTGSFINFGSAFAPGPSVSTLLDYVEVLTTCYNDYEAQQRLSANFRLVRVSNGQTVAQNTVTSEFSYTNPGSGLFGDQNTVSLIHRVTLKTNAVPLTVAPGDTFQLQIQTNGIAGTTFTDDFYAFVTMFYQHAHDVSVGAGGAHTHDIAAHSHPILFGIWQFDGDGGTGDGNPVYGTGIKLAVDPPSLSATGLPTNYDNERVPLKFGTKDAPQSTLVDITGYLKTDSNGGIASGVHQVFFLAEVGDPSGAYSNLQGLATVAVTPVLQFRSGGE